MFASILMLNYFFYYKIKKNYLLYIYYHIVCYHIFRKNLIINYIHFILYNFLILVYLLLHFIWIFSRP